MTSQVVHHRPRLPTILCRFVVADTTLALEKGGGSSAHFSHEHPDAFSSELDVSDTSTTTHRHILQAIEADVLKMKAGSSAFRNSESNSESAGAATSSALASSASSLLHDMLGCFILRRTKDSVDLQLPPKTRVVHWVDATPTQSRILETLKRATLLLIGPESVLGRSVLEASSATSAVHAAAGAGAPVVAELESELSEPLAPTCFVGDLCGVLPRAGDAAACLAEIHAGRVGNASGKLLMLLRKAALHPLLVRSRFSNNRVLALAAFIFESTLPQQVTFSSPDVFVPLSSGGDAADSAVLASTSDAYADGDLVGPHIAVTRDALVRWAESRLRSSQPPQVPTARLVKALADVAEGLLQASVRWRGVIL